MNQSIVVTGFGPFIGHEDVNASWEAVRLLPDSLLSDQNIEYSIEKKLVSVDYDDVNKAVDEIWAKKPMLVVHCGVHGGSKCIRVEELAYNHKFNRQDYSGKKLPGASACLANNGTSCNVLRTKLNVKHIVEKTTPLCGCNDPMVCSDDVGNYLCGYIYLKSLDQDCARSLFVHVPPIDKPFGSKETSDMIYKIIAECIRQLESCDEDYCPFEPLSTGIEPNILGIAEELYPIGSLSKEKIRPNEDTSAYWEENYSTEPLSTEETGSSEPNIPRVDTSAYWEENYSTEPVSTEETGSSEPNIPRVDTSAYWEENHSTEPLSTGENCSTKPLSKIPGAHSSVDREEIPGVDSSGDREEIYPTEPLSTGEDCSIKPVSEVPEVVSSVDSEETSSKVPEVDEFGFETSNENNNDTDVCGYDEDYTECCECDGNEYD